MQNNLSAGIFACDEAVVYSSVAEDIGNVKTVVVQGTNLRANLDPWTRTVQNTWIFHQVWKQVLQDGRWKHHGWTVKADPDAVFIPRRLRDITQDPWVAKQSLQGNGAWLNNCKLGLHGPLEVLSRRAMEIFDGSINWCNLGFAQEDRYLKHCMWQSGIEQVNAFTVLAEQNCLTPNWWTCQGNYVAYHPFKDPTGWAGCFYAMH